MLQFCIFLCLLLSLSPIEISFAQQQPLCQQGHLFYPRTQRCYQSFSQGPCGKNMVLIQETNNSEFGLCDCNYYTQETPMIYSSKYRRCYSLYQEAYCGTGNWLVVGKGGRPTCEIRKCKTKSTDGSIYIPFKSRCVELFKTAPECPSPEHIVKFSKGSYFPTCDILKSSFGRVNAKHNYTET